MNTSCHNYKQVMQHAWVNLVWRIVVSLADFTSCPFTISVAIASCNVSGVHACDMSGVHVRATNWATHMCETWLICVCSTTCSCKRHDSFVRVALLCSFTCTTWLKHTFDVLNHAYIEIYLCSWRTRYRSNPPKSPIHPRKSTAK